MYQSDEKLAVAFPRVATLTGLDQRLLDAVVIAGVAVFWGILLFLAVSAASI